MPTSDPQIQVEGLIIHADALRRVHRDSANTHSNTVVHRRNVDGNTAAESCYICLEGWEIGEDMVTLRCECPYWTHEICLAKSVSQTGRCPTCQTSIVRLDDEIGLARVAAEGNIAEVRRLLEKGTQHSPRDPIDSTPLLQAALQGHLWVVQLLLEHGASVSEQDRYQRTALYWASLGGHDRVAEELLLRGADTSTTDEKGQTLLHLAVESGSPQMVISLINRGAAMSTQDHGGRTPLHLAAEKGSQKMIKLLISQGAEPSPVDREVPADNGSYPDLNSRDWKRVLRGGGSSHMIHFMRMELKKLGNLPSTGSFRLPEAGQLLDLGSLAFIEPLERDIQSHAPYLSAFLTMLPRPAHKKDHNPMKFGARQAIWAIIS